MYSGITTNTISYMLREGDYKLIVYEGYPSRLFNLVDDPQELNDLVATEPDRVATMEEKINGLVNREETWRIWEDYRRHAFAQFQRQAKRGLYWDDSYGLKGKPSSDYGELMSNTFTGWDDADEARVAQWLATP